LRRYYPITLSRGALHVPIGGFMAIIPIFGADVGANGNSPVPYSYTQFESDVTKFKPRVFDTYILPAFLLYFAVKSKSGMGRGARRALFTAGVYMIYRNYSEYKNLVVALKAKITPEVQA